MYLASHSVPCPPMGALRYHDNMHKRDVGEPAGTTAPVGQARNRAH